jgi:hypothetical protein
MKQLREWKATIDGREFRILAPTLAAARREALSVYREALGGGRRKVKVARGNPSHRKSKKAMKAARTALARTAGYSKTAARKIGKRAVYRGDKRKFGPDRLPKYKNPLPIGRTVTVKVKRRRDGKVELYR